jgi:hypothetical protein
MGTRWGSGVRNWERALSLEALCERGQAAGHGWTLEMELLPPHQQVTVLENQGVRGEGTAPVPPRAPKPGLRPLGVGMSGEVSGVDLARVALRAALEAARKNGGSGRAVKPKPRTASAVRRGGREPLDLGTAIGPGSSRPSALPCADGREANAPDLAGYVAAVPRPVRIICAATRCGRGLSSWMPVTPRPLGPPGKPTEAADL